MSDTHSHLEKIPILECNLTLPWRFIYGVSVLDEVGCSLGYGILERDGDNTEKSIAIVVTVYLPAFPSDVPPCCSARIRVKLWFNRVKM